MQVTKVFLKNVRAYFTEPNAIKRDEIAGRQAWLLDEPTSGSASFAFQM
jgi:hypothetical protein